jgi:hypothetical protein
MRGLDTFSRPRRLDAAADMLCHTLPSQFASLLTWDESSLLPPISVYSKVTRRPVALK